MNEGYFTEDFKDRPFWWDAAPPAQGDVGSLPNRVDVAVVGAGYTGLHAAIQTARAGLETVILEAGGLGTGCSSRNGGQVSTSIKPSYAKLASRHGPDLAIRILREGQASRDFTERFIADENLDADFRSVGRFVGAHCVRSYENLAKEIAAPNPAFETGAYTVSPDDISAELGTNVYQGGCVFPRHASLDPGKYHKALVKTAATSGVRVFPYTEVSHFERLNPGFRVGYNKGDLRASKLIVATNGYSGRLSQWHQRRIIPIGSYIIATDIVPQRLMDRLFPTDRVVSDTRRLVYYFRPSPDRRRIIFGGRVSLNETDPRKSGPMLLRELVRIFPELAGTRISHSWMGRVAYTFDALMHTGEDRGLYHSMGYCGSGVGMAGYLGMKVGRKAAGYSDAGSVFDEITFPKRRFYGGNPWFLAPSVLAYRLRDRIGV